jgi:antirestriction protein ArdC
MSSSLHRNTKSRSASASFDDAHRRLVAAVDGLVAGEDWRQMLEVARRFHAYSTCNVFLILVQRPDATRVAGYRTWATVGRQVRRGEKGIAILAPLVSRARPVDAREEADEPELVQVLRGFRVVHVFDLSQTEGDPLVEVAPTLLTDGAPGELWETLAAQVASAGFALQRGDCGPANGVTDFLDRTVTVRDDVAGAQASKTLAHELAHVLLHDTAEHRGCRGVAEVEAESVAYLVCSHAGITADTYSFPYVARWSGGDLELVRSTAERVVTCARRIIDLGNLSVQRNVE